jgi:hypothetical protein
MSDQGLIIRGLGVCHREFRFGVRGAGRFGDECRLQCFDVVRDCVKARIHRRIESQIVLADS